ncbi:MAG: transposase [Candidatus Thiodiazotropha sp. (ex Lucinoma kastoroae)]|nr:transposase [Candidatus Thiodiazotropha sp. (ex Lucinoma kastoroae)]
MSIAAVDCCDICAENISELPCTHHERRTKIDIVFEKVIEHMDAEIKQCPACGSTVSSSPQKRLTDTELTHLRKRYRNILTRGEKELPPMPPKPSRKRGKPAKSDAHHRHERLSVYESAVLLFAKDPPVAFTNNRAEREVRMAKVKQKVSDCFRVELYAKAYCRISSYRQTMANKGHHPLIAIQRTLAGELEL